MLTDKNVSFWLEHQLNVLLIGMHGTGKTSIVKKHFTERYGKMGEGWLYFSAPTLDPWVDFVGVPQKVTDEKTGLSYLDLVRPLAFANNSIRAIFLDEANRAPKKVQNAIMELVQFGSINGRPFPNLEVIWAAINPHDDKQQMYNTEKMDPAQLDRFPVQIEVPYEVSQEYFAEQYGTEVAKAAKEWWDDLTWEHKLLCSPRRLDYALDIWQQNGDIRWVLDKKLDQKKLMDRIQATPLMGVMNAIFEAKDTVAGRKFIEDEQHFVFARRAISRKTDLMAFWLPLMPDEKIALLVSEERNVKNFALREFAKYPTIRTVLDEIVKARGNTELANEIRRVLQSYRATTAIASGHDVKVSPDRAKGYSNMPKNERLDSILTAIGSMAVDNPFDRQQAYEQMERQIPAEMSRDQAERFLTVLDKVVGPTHATTLDRWKNLMGIVNNLVEKLHKGGYDFAKFSGAFPKIWKYASGKPGFYIGSGG